VLRPLFSKNRRGGSAGRAFAVNQRRKIDMLRPTALNNYPPRIGFGRRSPPFLTPDADVNGKRVDLSNLTECAFCADAGRWHKRTRVPCGRTFRSIAYQCSCHRQWEIQTRSFATTIRMAGRNSGVIADGFSPDADDMRSGYQLMHIGRSCASKTFRTA